MCISCKRSFSEALQLSGSEGSRVHFLLHVTRISLQFILKIVLNQVASTFRRGKSSTSSTMFVPFPISENTDLLYNSTNSLNLLTLEGRTLITVKSCILISWESLVQKISKALIAIHSTIEDLLSPQQSSGIKSCISIPERKILRNPSDVWRPRRRSRVKCLLEKPSVT